MNALKTMLLLNKVEIKFKELLTANLSYGVLDSTIRSQPLTPSEIMDYYQEAVKLVIEELANEEA